MAGPGLAGRMATSRPAPEDVAHTQVDATDLPATLGPESITRNALAYQLSTTILACWIKHP